MLTAANGPGSSRGADSSIPSTLQHTSEPSTRTAHASPEPGARLTSRMRPCWVVRLSSPALPQHASVSSRRMPHAVNEPALTDRNAPAGGRLLPSLPAAQHVSVASARMPHDCMNPVLTVRNAPAGGSGAPGPQQASVLSSRTTHVEEPVALTRASDAPSG